MLLISTPSDPLIYSYRNKLSPISSLNYPLNSHRDDWFINTNLCQNSSLIINLNPHMLPAAILKIGVLTYNKMNLYLICSTIIRQFSSGKRFFVI